MTTLHITDQSTREEVAEALTHLAHRATREFPVVGTADSPTPWDLRHVAINDLLDDLQRATS
jgi:hypothetical protein